VSREIDGDESKTTLGVPLAKVTSSAESAQVELLVVWNEEVILGIAAESLCTVPCHILDGHERSVGKQDKVKHAVANDGAVVLLNHTRENAESGWRRSVILQYTTAALLPLLEWSVDGFLYLSAVEVDGCAFWEVAEAAREAKNVP